MGAAVSILIVVSLSMMPDNNKTLPASLDAEEISWVEFCKARGYDVHDNSATAVDEYLDTWCGSTEEEEALTRNGVPA